MSGKSSSPARRPEPARAAARATAPLRVRKYGGTSVGTVGRIRRIARALAEAHRRGERQVVVASAMARTTERLLDMARRVAPRPDARELDMILATGEQQSIALLAMALRSLGVPAVSFTGAQGGILTDSRHTRARIRAVETRRLERALDEGNVVIVAGFQGVSESDEITTLGRGGSDVTAAAVAAALGAASCEIYTDVPGVLTADPRVVPGARLLRWVGYAEMLELAASGSRVLHPRAVEIAYRFGLPLRVLSSFRGGDGTTIVAEEELETVAVTGVTGDRAVARIALAGVRDEPGIAARIARALADAGIHIRLVIQGTARDGRQDLSLVVDEADVDAAAEALRGVAAAVGGTEVRVDTRVAKVSIVGSGIASHPEAAARMFEALAGAGINIELISTSEVRIACVIRDDRLEDALRVLHAAFELERLERRRKDEPGRQD